MPGNLQVVVVDIFLGRHRFHLGSENTESSLASSHEITILSTRITFLTTGWARFLPFSWV